MQTDKELIKAWQIIDRMKPGQIRDLTNREPERNVIFIECAKQYIDCYNTGEFNECYTKFKKLNKWN